MKRLIINSIVWLTCLLLLNPVFSQEEKKELVLTLGYFSSNNTIPYLQVYTRTKADRKIELLKGAVVSVYMDSKDEDGLLGKVSTNDKGVARVVIPPAMKAAWESSWQHTFIAVAEAGKDYSDAGTEIEITKAKLSIDTLTEEEGRFVTATITAFDGREWMPVEEVDIKTGIRRLGGFLPAGDEEVYTTDSTGGIKAAFTRDSLPGDEKGNIVLVATVEDNDLYGNLSIEKTVPWGRTFKPVNDFNKRTLWATRDKVPLWLLFMTYSIIIAVWGVIIYLVFQLIRIKKLGNDIA